MPRVMWFRRDLRRQDNPALAAAAHGAERRASPLFVLDPALWRPAGAPRQSHLLRSLRALDAELVAISWCVAATLSTGRGPRPAASARARCTSQRTTARTGAASRRARGGSAPGSRHRAGDHWILVRGCAGPGGQGRRDAVRGVHAVLQGVARAWLATAGGDAGPGDVGGRRPAGPGHGALAEPSGTADDLPPAGERAALRAWERWRDHHLADYDAERNRPDLDTSSRLSVPLKYGEIHPRTFWPISAPAGARARMRFAGSCAGGSSTRTCSGTTRSRPGNTSSRSRRRPRTTTTPGPTSCSRPGARGGPATRSSMPACGS